MSRQHKQPGAGLALLGKREPCQHHWFSLSLPKTWAFCSTLEGSVSSKRFAGTQEHFSWTQKHTWPHQDAKRGGSRHLPSAPAHVQPSSCSVARWSWSPLSTDAGRSVSYRPSSCCLAPFPRGRTENGASSRLRGRGAFSLQRARGPERWKQTARVPRRAFTGAFRNAGALRRKFLGQFFLLPCLQ